MTVRIGRRLCLILRHKPSSIGIELDENGYANIRELTRGMGISKGVLKDVVETDDKCRYKVDDNFTKIKCIQGHSIDIKPEAVEKEPPMYLFHGTNYKNLSLIYESGAIKKMNRTHVHLSPDTDSAKKVAGRRRQQTPCVITIEAYLMYTEGFKFQLTENNVWLVDEVPVKYIIDTSHCEAFESLNDWLDGKS